MNYSDTNKLFSKILNPECDIIVDDRVSIGVNVVLGKKCKKIKLGYGTTLGRDIFIDVEELIVGEYTTIHHGCVISGVKTWIGHNCWIGHYSIIDSLGGFTKINNNVGIGAHSQLWTHMRFGDVLDGCNWNTSGQIILEDDVWLVGHCIVSPIKAGARSMLMVGSILTKDMDENKIYAGTPARDMSEKFGEQFTKRSIEEKEVLFEELKTCFKNKCNLNTDSLKSVNCLKNLKNRNKNVTYFDLCERTYSPIRTEIEYQFIKFILYDKAKFVPT